jgi:hypothetical protein
VVLEQGVDRVIEGVVDGGLGVVDGGGPLTVTCG